MKKLISILLVVCFIFTLASCSKNNPPSQETSPENTVESFVKPEKYASVLLVTINPQFRLYLDEDGKVLAVEAVNEDAESIKDGITFENQSYETVIKNIVTKAKESGFVKEDATVKFSIVESKETNKTQSDILSKAEKTASETADELKIEIKVTSDEIKTNDDTNKTDKETNDKNTDDNQVTSKPTHVHSYTAATCAEPKKCSCGAVDGKSLGHSYKDGVCTRCKAKDPNYKPMTSVVKKQGKWTYDYLYKNELYAVELRTGNSSEKYISVSIGDLLSGLPTDMQNDPNIYKYCKKYNGKYYYLGKGGGDSLKSVNESSNTVTITDNKGNKLVLSRTGENTMKCTSVDKNFTCLPGLPVGAVFTFVAA